MNWTRIMYAVPSPGGIPPIEMDKVAKLTAGLGAELELFHCIYDADVARPGRFASRGARQDIHEFVEHRRQQLEITAGRLRARGLRVRTSIRWDYPTYEGIVRQVLRHSPGVLIARTTTKGPGERLRLTRTDFKLIENCPCPVLFLKTLRSYSDVVMAAAVDPALAHDKPAALDLQILDAAGRVRDALCARLLLFHARAPGEQNEQSSAATQEASTSRICGLAQQYGIPRQRVHIEDGHPAQALPEFARRQMADIVVLGVAARSPLRRAFIGHTAERVIDALACDVLVVKAPEFKTPVGRQSRHHVPKTSAIPSRYRW